MPKTERELYLATFNAALLTAGNLLSKNARLTFDHAEVTPTDWAHKVAEEAVDISRKYYNGETSPKG